MNTINIANNITFRFITSKYVEEILQSDFISLANGDLTLEIRRIARPPGTPLDSIGLRIIVVCESQDWATRVEAVVRNGALYRPEKYTKVSGYFAEDSSDEIEIAARVNEYLLESDRWL
jgi:hypothetical protein